MDHFSIGANKYTLDVEKITNEHDQAYENAIPMCVKIFKDFNSRGFNSKEFFLMFQPIVALHDDTIIGAEAFVRWKHPNLNCINPSDFIPIADECKIALPMGEWILKEAYGIKTQWIKKGITTSPFLLFINLSPKQLRFVYGLTQIIENIGSGLSKVNFDLSHGLFNKRYSEISDLLYKNKVNYSLDG